MRKGTLRNVLFTLALTGMLFGVTVAPVMASPITITYQTTYGQYVAVDYLSALSTPAVRTALTSALATAELANLPIFVTDSNGAVINYMTAINKSENYAAALYDSAVNNAIAPTVTELYPTSPVSDPAVLESVSAVNGALTATLSVSPTVTPVFADFTVTASGVAITPTAISTSGSIVTLTVPTTGTTATSQPVVYSVSYKGGAPVVANIQITNLTSNSVRVGQNFNAVLYTSGDATDGGYVWTYTTNNDAIKFVRLNYSTPTAGSPTEEIFTFQATQAGSFQLRFSMEQPWVGSTSSVQTMDYTINVS